MKKSTLHPDYKAICMSFSNFRKTIPLVFLFFTFMLLSFNGFTAVSLRGTTNSTTNSTTLLIGKPVGLAVGDVMIAQVLQSSTVSSVLTLDDATTTGWTFLANGNIRAEAGHYTKVTLFYKVANATDVLAPSFSFSFDTDAQDGVGAIVAFSGVDTQNGFNPSGGTGGPFDIVPGIQYQGLGNDVSLNALGIFTQTAQAAIVMFGAISDNYNVSDWATNQSLTEIYDVAYDANEDITVGAAWGIQAAAGNTGSGNATISGTAWNSSFLIALRAAQAPVITDFTPRNGCIESTSVVITGINFINVTAVSFNGTPTTYSVNSSTQITAVVPNSATSGTLTVVTTAGIATSSQTFSVTPSPELFSMTGGGSYVGTAGAPVGLSNSRIGTRYQLLKNGTNWTTAVMGNTAPLNFGNQLAGTYTVLATDTASKCSRLMAGQAVVSLVTSDYSIYSSNGTFTAPYGVTCIRVDAWGGGGGGGSASSATGGGGGGAYTAGIVGVTPNSPITVTVGNAGAVGNAGGASSVGGVTANGGQSTTGAAGGAGGASVPLNPGIIASFAGGNGGNGIALSGGGGGGGSALYNGAGSNGGIPAVPSPTVGGTGGGGTGSGGVGSAEDGDLPATSGTFPGGGGGGRGNNLEITNSTGTSQPGAGGVVKISWTAYVIPNITVCQNNSSVSMVSATSCPGNVVNHNGANSGTATLNWYNQAVGGTLLETGTSLNPITDTEARVAYPGLATNPATIGTYTFYTECSMTPGCRFPVTYTIVAAPVAPTLNVKTPNVLSVCRGTGVSATVNAGTGGVSCNDSLRYRLSPTSAWLTYVSGTVIPTTTSTTTQVLIQAKRGGCTASAGCVETAWSFIAIWDVNEQPVLATAAKSPNLDNVCIGVEVSATITGGTGGVGCTDSYRYSLAGINGPWSAYVTSTPLSIASAANADTIIIQAMRGGCTANSGCTEIPWVTIAQWRVGLKPVIDKTLDGQFVFGYTDKDKCTDTVRYVVTTVGTPVPTLSFKFLNYDNSNIVLEQGQGTGSGSVFNKGLTYARVIATNSCGIKDSITMIINVADTVKPVFTRCPSEVIVPIGLDCKSDIPDLLAYVSATDNCVAAGSLIYSQTPSANSTLNLPHNSTRAASVTVRDYNTAGNLAVCNITLRAMDVLRPKITDCPSNRNVTLDSQCKFAVPNLMTELSGTDNCSAVNALIKTQLPASGTILSSAHNQQHKITMVLTDVNGLSDTCFVFLTGKDVTAPSITTCPANRNVDLNATCAIAVPNLIPSLVYVDNCIATVTQFPVAGTQISSANNQTHVVTLTVTDAAGLSASCNVTLTAKDVSVPVITCPAPRIADLSSNCTITTPNFISAITTSDNCGVTVTQSPAPGVVLASGHNQVHTVTLTATDAVGNTASCQVTVTARDVTVPTVLVKNIFLDLNTSGVASIIPSQIDNGSYDNCGVASIVLSKTSFNCNSVGQNTVVLTVTDINGNSATSNATVTVRDVTAPTALCKNSTVYLDNNGNAGITVSGINNSSVDNCTIFSTVLDKMTFNCSNVGSNTVKLTVTDVSGNSSFCNSIVTVLDTVRIKLTCPPDVNLVLTNSDCNSNLTIPVPFVSDNCLLSIVNNRNNSTNASGIYPVGITTVTWTATDKSLNTATCRQTITIKATPIANPDAVELDENSSIVVNPLVNDTDCENGIRPATFVVSVGPKRGAVSDIDLSSGRFKYTPTLNTYGKDSIRYTVCDNDGLCSSSWIRINVKRINFAPDAVNDAIATGNCKPVTFSVVANDSDPDLDPLAKPTIVENVVTGTLVLNVDGTFTYVPAAGHTGVVKFKYRVCDIPAILPSLCDEAEVTITVKQDIDCDAVTDDIDIDDDNDGITDAVESNLDTDNDTKPNSLDIDSDGDGIVDNVEAQADNNYRAPKWSDKDGDGLDDAYDTDSGGVALVPVDTDSDTKPDYLDNDSDADGMTDAIEGWSVTTDGKASISSAAKDSDADGLDDNYDNVNGWKISTNPIGSRAILRDFDGDGKRDWRDADDDGDGKPTLVENNNPKALIPNDYDWDGVLDYLDVSDSCDLLAPNGFSPDGDNINDYLVIQCLHNYPNSKMQVYTRSGNLIYENKNYGVNGNWWDGTSSHAWTVGNNKVPPGTYIYILIVGNGEVKKGTVYVNY